MDHYAWKTATFPVPECRYSRMVNTGAFYIYKRDREYRPILILNVERLCQINKVDPWSIDEVITFSSFLMGFMEDKLLIPGKVENWVFLIDLKNIGLTDVPVNKMKALVGSGQENFPCRFAMTYCVNANWQSRSIFWLCNVAMDEYTKSKITVCGDDLSKTLHKDINPNCLEKKFGGSLPN